MFALLPPQQYVEVRNPPAAEFTMHATVPGVRPPVTVPGVVTDSRLVLVLEDGTPITEIAARLPGGTGRVDVVPGSTPGPSSLVGHASSFGPGLARLWIDGLEFSLTDPAYLVGWHRVGRVMATGRFHRDLGQYGHAEWWITARDAQLDVALLWHRAAVGPDVLFREARIVTAQGVTWTPMLPDPASVGGSLVKPIPGGGLHVIPQQFARPFYFSVHRAGQSPAPEIVGVADWSRGGFMPSGFPVPSLPAHAWASQLADARWKLANLQPVEPWHPAPSSWLWPATGVHSGGEGGGIDRYALDGVRWAASHGAGEALEVYRIELLRGLSRARLRLDPDGTTLDLPPGGGWSFWDGFQNEGPWHWSSYPRRDGAYDPRRWADHDTASMERRLNEAWVLVWLANDPLARLVALEGASRGRLTFWEGRPLASSWGSGLGSDIGIWQAQAALAIAAARCMGAREYEPWRAAFLDHLQTVQMPSGCFTARQGGYPSDRAPFYGQFLLQGGSEFVHLQLAAYSLGERDVVRAAARGMVGIATDDGFHLWGEAPPGLYYFAPTGYVWPPGVRFAGSDTWPWALDWTMGQDPTGASYYSVWHMGHGVALAYATGAPEAPELLRRFLMGAGPMPPNPRAMLEGWGLEAPSGTHSSTPVEQWWPILGVMP